MLNRLRHSVILDRVKRRLLGGKVTKMFPLMMPLPLPDGVTEKELYNFVTSVRVADAPEAEMKAYGEHDFRRFVYTWDLARTATGKCLELGSNPYFTTMLLDEFSDLEVSLANYFSLEENGEHTQRINYLSRDGKTEHKELSFQHFNIEEDIFPYPDDEFDVVIFAEIIEHLLNDPCAVLAEIKRVLKPGGTTILTTPNVARLENIARLLSGANIYDPYSGYGPYGRHNREYNQHELYQLLDHMGFEVADVFSSDVHHNATEHFYSAEAIKGLLAKTPNRGSSLGQYIFIRARNVGPATPQKPSWLYRSYPDNELC